MNSSKDKVFMLGILAGVIGGVLIACILMRGSDRRPNRFDVRRGLAEYSATTGNCEWLSLEKIARRVRGTNEQGK